MNNILLVFIGGGLGSVVRFGVSEMIKNVGRSQFPFATLLSNIFSCLILALAVGVFSEKINNNIGLKTLIVIGFCGGFSTFSTFSFETVELIKAGNWMFALLNITISIVSCFLVVYFLAK